MSLTLDISSVVVGINRYLNRMADPVPFFDYVGIREMHEIRERLMSTKLDPDGNPWIPWAPYTAISRAFKGTASQGLLWDSGDLLDSIKFDVDGAFGVDIGSDIWYAPKHQDGAGKVPKRSFLGWDEDMLPLYAQAFANYIETGVP